MSHPDWHGQCHMTTDVEPGQLANTISIKGCAAADRVFALAREMTTQCMIAVMWTHLRNEFRDSDPPLFH